MTRILVAEDSSTQAVHIRSVLEEAGFEVELAVHGVEALQAIRRDPPALVVTDLNMPEMDGLALVEAIQQDHATLPVILITQFGSEELAVQALQKGAASYVPKRNLDRDLVPSIDEVLVIASAHRHQEWVLGSLTQTESHYVLDNNQDLIPPLIGHLQQNLRRMRLCDERDLIRVAVAINEAIMNAIYHGNLDVGSDLRDEDEETYLDLIHRRRDLAPYKDRRIHLWARESRAEAIYV